MGMVVCGVLYGWVRLCTGVGAGMGGWGQDREVESRG